MHPRLILCFSVFCVLCSAVCHASSKVDAGTLPRMASLKKGEVNVRSGPGNQYPILWVYQRPGYPVQLLARYDNYWKVRDIEGEEGWVFIGMVSPRLTGVVAGSAPVPLYRRNQADSPVVARLSPGLVVVLDEPCTPDGWCQGQTEGVKGYLRQSALTLEP